jgi:hypothetical protein
MKKLFNKNDITPSCSYCVHGRFSPNGESVLCLKKGIVSLDYSCKRFKYDPLKRKPIRPKAIETFEELDFSLEDFSLEFED